MVEAKANFPRYGLNLAADLPRTVWLPGFRELLDKAHEIGFDSVCVSPGFRVFAEDIRRGEKAVGALEDSGLEVVYFQKPWNPTRIGPLLAGVLMGGINQLVTRRINKDSQAPIVQDYLFNPERIWREWLNRLMGRFPLAKLVSYRFEAITDPRRLVIETTQGLNIVEKRTLTGIQESGMKVAFDARHLPGDARPADWEKVFNPLEEEGVIEIVDINPPSFEDLKGLHRGQGLLHDIVQAARKIAGVYFRVEVPMLVPGTGRPALTGRERESVCQLWKDTLAAIKEA